ncbi:MAG: hypothetical protein RSC76_06185, partial [Oscillospiraceae bacterium]
MCLQQLQKEGMVINMPEFIELSKLKDNLYKEGCPVVVAAGELLWDSEASEICARLAFRSISMKGITSVLVDLHVFDKANIEVEVIRDYLYLVENAKRGDLFGGDTKIAIENEYSKTIAVAIRRVAFCDDTLWDGSASLLFESIPERKTLEAELEDEETVAQFQRDFAGTLAKNTEAQAKFVPVEYRNLWLCSCGEINLNAEGECFSCGASFLPQRTHIDNRVEISGNLTLYKRGLAEKAEKERIEAEEKAASEAAAKAEVLQKAAEEQARLEALEKRRKRTRKIITAVSIPMAIAIIAYLILLFTYLIPQGNYNHAKELLLGGKYDEAITAFSAMETYQDSPEQVIEAKFQKAEKSLANQQYAEAIDQYTAIEKERDVKNRIQEAKYQQASALLTAEKFEDALLLFTDISSYRDAVEKNNLCHFNLAEKALKDEDLSTVTAHFQKLSGEYSLKFQKLLCDKGTALYGEGAADAALPYFSLITDPELLKTVDGVYYENAVNFLEKDRLDEAAALFTKISGFQDSGEQLLHIQYLKAEKQFASEKYREAIALYEAAGKFKGAEEGVRKCLYAIAKKDLAEGKYEEATKAFQGLQDYEDSAAKALESQYQYGVSLLNKGSIVDSYRVLYAIQNYEPAYALLVSDSQYYIHVYEAGLGSNPLDER